MNPILKSIGTMILTEVAAEGIKGVSEAYKQYSKSYNARRSVGYDVIPAIANAMDETKNYYKATINGEHPIMLKPAVFFDKK